VENKFKFNKSNSFDRGNNLNYFSIIDYGKERTREIDRNNVNLDGAMKITGSRMKKSITDKTTNHIFARVSSNTITKKVLTENMNLNDILEKNKDDVKKYL